MDLMYYSPTSVHVSILGKTIEGFAEDSFITIEPQNENYQTKTSMDGMVQMSGLPVRIHVVRLTLQQTAPVNALLHALMIMHKQFGSKLRIPIIIKSEDTNTSFTATEIWFRKEPTVSFGGGMNVVEWEFFTKNAVYSIGGNDDGSMQDLSQMVSQATQLAGLVNIDLDSILGTVGNLFSTVNFRL